MKWHLLILSVLLASFVVVSSLPVDSTALGARDASGIQQSLKSFDIGATQPLSKQSDPESFDGARKSTGGELLVAKKKKGKSGSSGKSKKSKKKKKKKNQKNKGKKSKASPSKTKKQKKK